MAISGTKKAESTLLLILACGATIEQAASQVGLSERTIYRRLADPDFRRRLAETRADMIQRTSGTLTATSAEAVRTLVTLLNPKEPPNVRLGAARAVLELGIKVREAADLENRMIELEAQVASLSSGPALRLIPQGRELTPLPGEPAGESTTTPVDPASELANAG